MTNMGIIEATTSAIGEELTKLFGFSSTRVVTQALPETQVQSSINSMDYDGAVTCTLTVGTFLLTVANPMRLRILSGAGVGAEAIVQTRDSGIQITLVNPLPNTAAFVGASWELVNDAETELEVESTLDFNSSGRIVLDGVVYYYTGTTGTSFTGLYYDDGTGLLVNGVKQTHQPLSIVADYSRARSALDLYRRSFLIEYATGKDLDILGKNIGVERPPELTSDDTYRRLVQAVAYAPRGTVFAMEQVLDVLLGETEIASGVETASGTGDPYIISLVSGTFPTDIEGFRFRVTSGYLKDRTVRIAERIDATHVRLNIPMEEDFSLESWQITQPNWDLFEDLTLGSIHHGCTVFFLKSNTPDEFVGKAFLDGEDHRPLSNSTTLNFGGYGAMVVASVRLKDEGGVQLIDSGTDLEVAYSPDGISVTATTPGTFSTRIMPGDYFQLLDGGLRGVFGVVRQRNSDVNIQLGLVDGASNPSPTPTGVIGQPFSGLSWQVVRDKSNVLHYRPSAEVRLEWPGDAGTQTWDYVGLNEVTRVTLGADATAGQRLLINPANDRVAYRRRLRITPEAKASVEMLLDVGTGSLATAANSAKQMGCALSDGERTIAWGVIDDAGNLQSRVGFINMVNGQFIGSTPKAIWSDTTNTKYNPGFNLIRMEKVGRDRVRLLRQAWQGGIPTSGWEVIDELAYSSFPTVGAWTAASPWVATNYEIAWGTMESGRTNQTRVKFVDWSVKNPVDFWNMHHDSMDTQSPNVLQDGGTPFVSPTGDIGKLIRIKDFGALNAAGGNSLGLWEIETVPSTSNVTLVGETKYGGGFRLENRFALWVRGDLPFSWPDHRGHSIEILDGPNAGLYEIAAILDPETLEDVEDLPLPATIADSVNWTSRSAQVFKVRSYVVVLDTAGGTPSLPTGFSIVDDETRWRIVPNFPNDSDVDYELVAAGTQSGADLLTFREALPWGSGQVMSVHSSKVLSAGVFHEREQNQLTPPSTYRMYPFYLYDGFGYVRTVMDIVKAAGILPDFERLFVDAAGRHILGADSSGSFVAPPNANRTGSAHGSSVVVGTLIGIGSMVGLAAGASTVSGTIVSPGSMVGLSAGVGAASGTLIGEGELAGASSGVASVSGTLQGEGALVGTAAGVATVEGDLTTFP